MLVAEKVRARVREQLIQAGANPDDWGRSGGTKTFNEFLGLLHQGEVDLLEDNTLFVKRACLRVLCRTPSGLLLLTEHKTFRNGGIRTSKRLKEKVRPGETYEEAALRCIKEELRIDGEVMTLHPDLEGETEERRVSDSFPPLIELSKSASYFWIMPYQLFKPFYTEEKWDRASVFIWTNDIPKKVLAQVSALENLYTNS
jgi:ADP-ribose pyrophosphatase YjhB (NUDIX family)